MIDIPKEAKEILAMAGLAAMNHGLIKEGETIFSASGYFIENKENLAFLKSVIHYMLGRKEEALTELSTFDTPEIRGLKEIIFSEKNIL